MKTFPTSINCPQLRIFIEKRLHLPVHTERFTACFKLTGPGCGQILFRECGGEREAILGWEAWFNGEQVQARLVYNQSFELLRTAGDFFRDQVACAFPIF